MVMPTGYQPPVRDTWHKGPDGSVWRLIMLGDAVIAWRRYI